ncbi:unnamed protein product [Didymodactylos carnosus]|uniref:Lon N-terminal domain-containing protein n=1 Tax=Didymodactylos carnosus TaxID=1234261 RepID=A0A8S2D2G8_9BILA|nr:unnamed protein product [Didymodactylos carnosus]CAF3579914.1 unnamed protein product [Didymodactylos carnosus]
MPKLPVLVTRGIILFPQSSQPIEVGRERSIKAIEEAIATYDAKIIVVSQTNSQQDNPTLAEIYMVGTIASITVNDRAKDGSFKITATGETRVKIKQFDESDQLLLADYEPIKTITTGKVEIKAKVDLIMTSFEEFARKSVDPNAKPGKKGAFATVSDPEAFVDQLSSAMPLSTPKKQQLLEEAELLKRLDILLKEAKNEAKDQRSDREASRINSDIDKKVTDSLNKQQREYYLRERLRAIKEELGEINSKDSDVDNLRKRVNANPYPEHIKKRLLEEITRYESTPPVSQEANIIKTYVD